MIDITKAKKVFAEYVKAFDSSNGMIALKITHILKVAEVSKNLAIELGLNKEDQEIAEIIGLLHDIGRFEQVKKYNTYSDRQSENHAAIGIRVLFEDGWINEFVESREYDDTIKIAILNHNQDYIDEGLPAKTELFCKIIRDADKFDIYRVATEDPMQDAFGISSFSNEVISDAIYKDYMENKKIDYSHLKTHADGVACNLAFIFDVNFDSILQKIYERKYLEKVVKRANFQNPETFERGQNMLKLANDYMEKRLNLK